MNPLLTIVVPVYNRQTLITRTLDSIAAARQTQPLTLLIIDNNSYYSAEARNQGFDKPDSNAIEINDF